MSIYHVLHPVPHQGLKRRKEVATARSLLELLQELAHVASKVRARCVLSPWPCIPFFFQPLPCHLP